MAEEEAHRTAEEIAQATQPRKTWYAWATGSESGGGDDDAPMSLDVGGEIRLSDEQRGKLSALLSGGAEAASAPLAAASAEYVEHTLQLTLAQLSFTLTADPENGHRSPVDELATLTLRSFSLGVDARVAGLRVAGSLHSLDLVDCQAKPGTLGHAMIRHATGGPTTTTSTSVAAPASPGSPTSKDAAAEPQWRFRVVQRPPNIPEDFEVHLSVASPLQVVHNAPLMRRFVRFFAAANETERAALAALVGNALQDAGQALRELTSEALEAVLARRTTTRLSLQLAAPRLILPEDLDNPSSPLLIVDMGEIALHSTVGDTDAAAVEIADPAAAASAVGGVDSSALYDRFNLELSSMQVLIAPADVDWQDEREQLRRRLHVLYRFGLDLELRMCILPSASHALDQFIITGALSERGSPSINVRLSTAQLRTLTAIVRTFTDNAPPSSPPPAARPGSAPQSPLLYASTTHHTPARSTPSRTGGHGGGAEASPAGASTAMRAELAVQNIIIVLSDEVDGAERELAMLRTSNIALMIAQRKAGYAARFSLENLVMEDRTPRADADAHSLRLLDSRPPAALGGHGNAQRADGDEPKLVHLEYTSTPGEPDEVRVRFSVLHVEWNPETIAALLSFVRLPVPDATRRVGSMRSPPQTPAFDLPGSVMLQGGVESARKGTGAFDNVDPSQSIIVEATSGIGGDEGAGDAQPKNEIRVVAQLQSLSVSLNAERSGERLALLAMTDLGANVRLPADGGMIIGGQLGNLTAQDTLTNPSSPYEMLGLRASESSLLTFEYNSPNEEARAAMRSEGLYDSSVKLRMSSVQVSYWQPAVMRTVSYLQSGVLGALTSATATTMAHMARSMLDVEVSAMSLDVEIGSPLLLLPTVAGGSVGLLADLGRMGVHNTLVRRVETEGRSFGAVGIDREVVLDTIRVTVEQMKVDSVDCTSMSAAFEDPGVQMLRDVALEVLVERGVGASMTRPLTVTGRGGELTCDCSKVQYELLMRVFLSNLAGKGDTRGKYLAPSDHSSTPVKGRISHEPPSPSASAITPDSSSSVTHAVEMRVSFLLPLLTLRLSDKKVLSSGARPLACVALREMQLSYSSFGGPMELALSLQALHISDELQGGLQLIDSLPPVKNEEAHALADLLYKSGFAGQPDEVRLRFSRLHVEWHPETIAALLAFVRLPASNVGREGSRTPPEGAQPPLGNLGSSSMVESVYHSALLTPGGRGSASAAAPDTVASSTASLYVDATSEAGDDVGDPSVLGEVDARSGNELLVVAQLQSLSVSLNAERSGERLALLAMTDLGANVRLPADGGMIIGGQLGNLTAQDTLTNPSSPYEMLGLRASESSLLTFEYNSPNEEARAAMRSEGLYDSSVKLRMSSVQVSYWQPAVMRTVSYLQSGVLGALTSATATTMAHMARSMLDVEVSAMSLDVEIGSPLLLLPTVAGGSVGLLADLGRMGVHNTLVRRVETEGRSFGAVGIDREVVLDTIRVTVEQMKVDSVDCTSMSAAFEDPGVQMLRDVALEVLVERGVGASMTRPLTVTGRGGELTCDCSKVQYELLMRVFLSNLASKGDTLAHADDELGALTPVSHKSPQASRRAYNSAMSPPGADSPEVGRLSICAKLELGGATLRLADARGPLILAGLRLFSAEVKTQTTGDLEVALSCGSVELRSTRAQATGGMERLLWGEHPARTTPGGPPQLHLVYSTEEGGTARTLVANLHGTKVNLLFGAFLATADFFVASDARPAAGTLPQPAAQPTAPPGSAAGDSHVNLDSAVGSSLEAAELDPLGGVIPVGGGAATSSSWAGLVTGTPAVEKKGRLVLLFSLEETEVMVPRRPEVRGSDGVVAKGACVLKYRDERAGEQLDLEVSDTWHLKRAMLGHTRARGFRT